MTETTISTTPRQLGFALLNLVFDEREIVDILVEHNIKQGIDHTQNIRALLTSKLKVSLTIKICNR